MKIQLKNILYEIKGIYNNYILELHMEKRTSSTTSDNVKYPKTPEETIEMYEEKREAYKLIIKTLRENNKI